MQRHFWDRAGLLGLNVLTHEKDQPGLEPDASEWQACGFLLGIVKTAACAVIFNKSSCGFPWDLHMGREYSVESDSCIVQHNY